MPNTMTGAGFETKPIFNKFFRCAETKERSLVALLFVLKQRSITGPLNFEHIPQLVERGRAGAMEFLEMLNAHLDDNEFVCGANFTMADISAFVTVDFAGWIKLSIGEEQQAPRRWFDAVRARPSAQA